MDDQEISTTAHEPTAAQSPASNIAFTTLTALMQQQARAGWVWEEKAQILAHPRDPQLYFRIDPATYHLSVSTKLAAQLATGTSPEGRPS